MGKVRKTKWRSLLFKQIEKILKNKLLLCESCYQSRLCGKLLNPCVSKNMPLNWFLTLANYKFSHNRINYQTIVDPSEMTPAKTKSEKKQKRKQLSYKRFQEGKSRSSLVDDKTVIDIFVVRWNLKIIVSFYFVII